MSEIDVREEYNRVITKLILDKPLFGIMMKRLRVVYKPIISPEASPDMHVAAAVNAKEIIVSDKFFEQPIDQRMFIISHEAMHLISAHPERTEEMWNVYRDMIDPDTFGMICNIAEDAKINEALSTEFSSGPENMVNYNTLEQLFNMPQEWSAKSSVEDIVDRIIKDLPNIGAPIAGQGCGGISLPDGSHGGSSNDDEQGKINEKGTKSNDNGGMVLNEGSPELKEASKEQLPSVKRDLVAESIVVAKSIGHEAGFLQRIFDEIYKSEVNWKRVLRNALNSMGGDDVKKIWSRLNRKNELLPSKTTIGLNTVWCLVDTSGSISKREINSWVSEVLAIMRLKRKVMVISWDTIVHDINIIRSKKDIDNIRLTGGGGTIIRPALEYVNERKHFGDSVIVFSDFAIGDLDSKDVQKYLSKTLNFTTAVEPDFLRKEYGIKAVKIKVK